MWRSAAGVSPRGGDDKIRGLPQVNNDLFGAGDAAPAHHLLARGPLGRFDVVLVRGHGDVADAPGDGACHALGQRRR